MHSILLRPTGSEDDQWYRSVIVDFELDRELVVLNPELHHPDLTDAEGEEPPEELEGRIASAPEVDAGVVEPPQEAPAQGDDDVPEPIFSRGVRLDVEISFPDGIRRFSSTVQRLDLRYGGSLLLPWPTEGTRIQRRGFVRVDAAFKTTVWFRAEEEKGLEKVTGSTIDLSAGGVRLRLLEPIAADTRVELEIEAAALSAQTVQGRVIRSGELPKQRKKAQEYWVGVEFVGVGEGLRKELTQLIAHIERDRFKKAL